MPRYTAVPDACVARAGALTDALTDALLRVAEKGLYRPLWSDRILEAQAAVLSWEDRSTASSASHPVRRTNIR
jgi:hypothetical protein